VTPGFQSGPLQRFARRSVSRSCRERHATEPSAELARPARSPASSPLPRMRQRGVATPFRVADRWPSPLALLALDGRFVDWPLDSEVLPVRMRMEIGSSRGPTCLVFCLSLEDPALASPIAPRGPLPCSRPPDRRSGTRPSQAEPGTSSPGVLQRPPLRRRQPFASTPGRGDRSHPFLRRGGSQPPRPFRPCRSSRLRRLSPRIALRACCIPQPTMGFTSFRSLLAVRADHPGAFSPRRHTLRSLPLADSRTTSPWPLPSRRHGRATCATPTCSTP
jgi:hypothetical protein